MYTNLFDNFSQKSLRQKTFGSLSHLPILVIFLFAKPISEAEPGGMKTIYFRKNVWHFLRSRADCGFLHLCMDQEADSTEVRSSGTTGSQLGSQNTLAYLG